MVLCEKLRKLIPIKIVSTQTSELLQVRFFPTDICNFDCSYCFANSHNGKFRYPKNTDIVIDNFRKLFDLYINKLNKLKFHLMIAGGGEPTLWPEIERFCKEIKQSHDVYITIVTNGSRTVRWWEENAACFDDAVLSCHNEYVDIDHHIAVGDLLFAAGVKVTALMLMDAKNWDRCVSYIEKMKTSQHPWFIETKPVLDAPGHGIDVYTEDQLSYINDSLKRMPDNTWLMQRLNDLRVYESVVLFDDDTALAARPHEIITNKWNYFKGWKCNVGLEAISINASGEILGSCQLAIFGDKKQNIFSDNFTSDLIPSQIICSLESCNCQPDTHVTKFLP